MYVYYKEAFPGTWCFSSYFFSFRWNAYCALKKYCISLSLFHSPKFMPKFSKYFFYSFFIKKELFFFVQISKLFLQYIWSRVGGEVGNRNNKMSIYKIFVCVKVCVCVSMITWNHETMKFPQTYYSSTVIWRKEVQRWRNIFNESICDTWVSFNKSFTYILQTNAMTSHT